MKGILIALAFILAIPAYAMGKGLDPIQQKLRASPEMSVTCKRSISKYEARIKKYENHIAKRRKAGKNIRKLTIAKLSYLRVALESEIEYCKDENAEDNE